MNNANTTGATPSNSEIKPRLISPRKFALEQRLDYGYILRAIKSGELEAEHHGNRFKIDAEKASDWLKSKVYIPL